MFHLNHLLGKIGEGEKFGASHSSSEIRDKKREKGGEEKSITLTSCLLVAKEKKKQEKREKRVGTVHHCLCLRISFAIVLGKEGGKGGKGKVVGHPERTLISTKHSSFEFESREPVGVGHQVV